MSINKHLLVLLMTCLAVCSCNLEENSEIYVKIQVVDKETGRGIPMVRLKTLDFSTYYTDSHGYLAFSNPGLMNLELYFTLSSPGYSFPMDSTGRAGISLSTRPGTSHRIEMQRENTAERLYRATGSGIYRESHKLGIPAPIQQPLINAGVLGQDSDLSAIYKGKIFWVWGDTFLPPDYMGNFSVAAATSELPENGGLDPAIGIDYTYFTDERGFAKKMIEFSEPGYVWFDWLMNIKDEQGEEKLVAKYARVNAYFGNYERGIAVYNDEKELFEKYKEVEAWMDEGHLCNHPFKGFVDGEEYYFLSGEFGFQRVRPVLEDLANPAAYESFTCLKEGENFDSTTPALDRDEGGNLRYGWKKDTDAVDNKRLEQLIKAGRIKPQEAWVNIRDIDSGDPVLLSRGSVFWNEYRQKWILIMGINHIWYAEAESPVGPWGYAKKVADHDNALYNPLQHPFFDQEKGKQIFFEGTYTQFFGNTGPLVPAYNYNQLMYRLNLADPDLNMPAPVFRLNAVNKAWQFSMKRVGQNYEIPFYAWEKPYEEGGLIAMYKTEINGKARLSLEGRGEALFYALPRESDSLRMLLGRWECKVNFASFNNYVEFEIRQSKEGLKISSSKASFQLSQPGFKDGVLSFEILQEGKTYVLSGKIAQDKVEGKWIFKNSTFEGTWTASKIAKSWHPEFSKAAVPLFEYKHKATGVYSYSTKDKLNPAVYIQSPEPICRVFANPYTYVILDQEIKPYI